MGVYLNPGNMEFSRAVHSKIYVDKTMLIEHTNDALFTEQQFISVSRPRRFGKSMAVNMLAAYYGRGCDSRELFSGLKISDHPGFEKHLNQYNVIRINMRNALSRGKSVEGMIAILEKMISLELKRECRDVDFSEIDFMSYLEDAFAQTGISFVFIIDEWDCIFRVSKNDSTAQARYLDFLRFLLKDQPYVALAYMTGILPVKKYGEHSALNMFTEITVTNPMEYAEFTGFTEPEVAALSEKYGVSLDETKRWYDGYDVMGISIYNPRSVVMVMLSGIFDSYWTQTETYEALKIYIQMGYDGLRERVARLIAGENISVNIEKFQNDMTTLAGADDVLTLLIHLGYLTYDFSKKTCRIPNNEVRREFINCIETEGYPRMVEAIRSSAELLRQTFLENEEEVALRIEKIHEENSSILRYNDETSLAYAVELAYYAAQETYALYREMPAGKGFADLVYVPDRACMTPALVIELKWNRTAETALDQIRRHNYAECLKHYQGEILLVGISYDRDLRKGGKKHFCKIERVIKDMPVGSSKTE
ncbi:MAG: AAA family ATPase [Lachnospiraceae bacterium]|nr:AAA family ATPase [Lachnospiraceae bacterium]